MSWYIKRGRKFRLSLTGSSNVCDRGRRLYVMAGNKERRTWCWWLIIAPKSAESARAATFLKVGASSGRNPPLLARRRKLSRWFRSDSFRRPHQSGDAQAYSIINNKDISFEIIKIIKLFLLRTIIVAKRWTKISILNFLLLIYIYHLMRHSVVA